MAGKITDYRNFGFCCGVVSQLTNINGWDGHPNWQNIPHGCCPICRQMTAIERTIKFKRNPSLHECDARCINATGPVCECSCGGRNHGGRNRLQCEALAA